MTDETELWRHNFSQLLFFVEVAQDNSSAAPNSRGVAERSVKEGLRDGVFHHLLEEHERKAIYSAHLRLIVTPVLDAVQVFLGSAMTSTQNFIEGLDKIAQLARQAKISIDSMTDGENVEQVIEEFETRYLATLAMTLSAHSTLARTLAARKSADGEYFDVGRYVFVRNPDPATVHVADLNSAMDSGVSSISMKRGMVSYDRFPPIQIMSYGQWFAYIHAIWDEWYRPRLAAAYSTRLGVDYLKNDIKSSFMGELNKIRNDVIHNKSRVKSSSSNVVLNWATDDGLIGLTTERMIELRTMFPRSELLKPPARSPAPSSQNIPWTAEIDLIDQVKLRLTELGMTKRQQKDIGDEMLRRWLDHNPLPSGSSTCR
ncbi:hypothetical protein [Rhodococcus sp. NPDC006774]|uniref:hypothetical protein n=1 Tax=Rhodococcus sp. NPDC006774 TaxID=3157186 RepID=UPI003408E1B8